MAANDGTMFKPGTLIDDMRPSGKELWVRSIGPIRSISNGM